MLYHDPHKLLERSLLRVPPQLRLRLRRVTEQLINFGRAEVLRIHLHQHLAGSDVDTLLIYAFAFPAELDSDFLESQSGELTHCMILAGSHHEIIRFRLLENEPHALYVVLGIAPVTEGIQITQIELVLESLRDACRRKRNLTRYKRLSAPLGLMIE